MRKTIVSEVCLYILDPSASDRHWAARTLSVLDAELEHAQRRGELLDAIDDTRPAVLLSEVHLCEMTGLELQSLLLREHPAVPMIFLTGEGQVRDAVAAMRRGAVDFLEKPCFASELLRAANEAVELARAWHRMQVDRQVTVERFDQLNDREKRVMPHLAQGRTNKEIARKLKMSLRSVEHYRRVVLEKMEAPSALKLPPTAQSRRSPA